MTRSIAFFNWEENIVGKGENADCQHFLLFPQCFQKAGYHNIDRLRNRSADDDSDSHGTNDLFC